MGRHPAQPVAARPAPPQPLADAPLGDRPWERASPGPEGTVACPGPHLITAAIRTINNPRAILLTAGSWGQEIEQPPSPRRPGGPEQWQSRHRQPQSEPLGLPNPATLASGRKGAWPQRWESRLQPPAASSSQLRSSAVTGVPSQASWPRPGGGAGKGAFGMRADWPLLLGADCCEVRGLGWPLAESSQGRPAQPGQGRLGSPAGNVQARGHSGEKGLPHFLLPAVPGPCRNSGLAVACLCSDGEPICPSGWPPVPGVPCTPVCGLAWVCSPPHSRDADSRKSIPTLQPGPASLAGRHWPRCPWVSLWL